MLKGRSDFGKFFRPYMLLQRASLLQLVLVSDIFLFRKIPTEWIINK